MGRKQCSMLFFAGACLALAMGFPSRIGESDSIQFNVEEGDWPPVYVQPQQIHISYGDDPTQMYVVWSTQQDTNSTVRYSLVGAGNVMVATGVSRMLLNGKIYKPHLQLIHRVKLTGLKPGQTYQYVCGSEMGWSAVFTFTALREGTNWSPRFAVYGDLGNVNAQSVPRLQQDTLKGMYDLVLHVGDFAYDMDKENGRIGDEFMKQIEPIAANLPYMTCPGNHEVASNFSNYKHRFVMPGDELGDKMFYSFNVGPAHIISFSTEYYFYIQYGLTQPAEQFRWLEKDLEEATKPENRAQRPWIITMAHRPMYCSNNDHDDCTKSESIIRTGWPKLHLLPLEPLFYKYGVDLELWAHEHSYERLWPVYDRKVYNGSYSEPYTNPGAPVHIITGSAGCQEKIDHFVSHVQGWSAVRISDYGYTRMTIYNATHLHIEQVSDDQNGKILDSFTIIKNSHGPYPPRTWQTPDYAEIEKEMARKGLKGTPVNKDSNGL